MTIKIVSWNIAGLNASLKRDDLEFINNPDNNISIVCLQETKVQKNKFKLPENINNNFPYQYWTFNPGTSQRVGFNGTSIWSKVEAIKQLEPPSFDVEGRITIIEFATFYLVNVYTPNSQSKDSPRCKYRIEEWDPQFRDYLNKLKNNENNKNVIVCGDFNVCNLDIDIYNPKKYKDQVAGFLDLERNEFKKHLEIGFVDAFRYINKDIINQYTYWNQRVPRMRQNNLGWRIDYFLVTNKLSEKIKDCKIYKELTGSDHCPIILDIDL